MKKAIESNAIKVLIVDDSATWRDVLRDILGKYDEIQILGECEDGEEVRNFLANNQPEVVLMDVSMKKMNGIEATCYVKQNYPTIQVIALSGKTDQSSRRLMRSAGASKYLVKGRASIQDIVKAIRAVYLSGLKLKKTKNEKIETTSNSRLRELNIDEILSF